MGRRNQREEGDSRRETLAVLIFIAQAPLPLPGCLRFEFDDLDRKFHPAVGVPACQVGCHEMLTCRAHSSVATCGLKSNRSFESVAGVPEE